MNRRPDLVEERRRKPFLSDVTELRRRAQRSIEQGRDPDGAGSYRATVAELLNQALAAEIVAARRYKRQAHLAPSIPVALQLLEQARDERAHAEAIIGRVAALGAAPDLDPGGLLTLLPGGDPDSERDLLDLIRESLVAKRVTIESYRSMIEYVRRGDPITRAVLEDIVEKEEEHAGILRLLIERLARPERE
jgi:bacterioferritin